MGKVTYFIDYYIPKTVKAQLSPFLPFKEGWRSKSKRWGRGVHDWGGERIFYLDREGEIREEVVFLINNLAQTGKIFLHWFDRNQFLTFPAKGMAFKVSCGGCNKY